MGMKQATVHSFFAEGVGKVVSRGDTDPGKSKRYYGQPYDYYVVVKKVTHPAAHLVAVQLNGTQEVTLGERDSVYILDEVSSSHIKQVYQDRYKQIEHEYNLRAS
jgi:hypothetical protein